MAAKPWVVEQMISFLVPFPSPEAPGLGNDIHQCQITGAPVAAMLSENSENKRQHCLKCDRLPVFTKQSRLQTLNAAHVFVWHS